MGDRRRVPSIYDGRFLQEPEVMRRGLVPGLSSSVYRSAEPRATTNHVEAKLAAQLSEIERLAGDNRMLATSHVALRGDLVASQHEIQKLKAYIRSIETEGDFQIRGLLEKIAKMEADLRAGESLKKEYHHEHLEAQSLVKDREDLMAQIQQKSKELEKARADIQRLPVLHAELDNLRQEHQRLRTSFQFEKSLNVDKVEKMQAMEKDLVGMAREVEMLRAAVLNAENRARAPDTHMHSNPVHPSIAHANGPVVENYCIPSTHQALGAMGGGISPHIVNGSTVWGGEYGTLPPPR